MSEWGRKLGDEIVSAVEAELAKQARPRPIGCECDTLHAQYGFPVMCRTCDAQMAAYMKANGGSWGPGV